MSTMFLDLGTIKFSFVAVRKKWVPQHDKTSIRNLLFPKKHRKTSLIRGPRIIASRVNAFFASAPRGLLFPCAGPKIYIGASPAPLIPASGATNS